MNKRNKQSTVIVVGKNTILLVIQWRSRKKTVKHLKKLIWLTKSTLQGALIGTALTENWICCINNVGLNNTWMIFFLR